MISGCGLAHHHLADDKTYTRYVSNLRLSEWPTYTMTGHSCTHHSLPPARRPRDAGAGRVWDCILVPCSLRMPHALRAWPSLDEPAISNDLIFTSLNSSRPSFTTTRTAVGNCFFILLPRGVSILIKQERGITTWTDLTLFRYGGTYHDILDNSAGLEKG
ncbi:hypothetical protein LX32DRAFT_100629 [Colletotrichum zoysiae]|uniref:Uncharacterized protein n=1 Tax=Colletotrichum zoysiae TaxID=1216348 RepID=A0AAD9M077_9PEZI|nr:hypothetical protein LX32DRAFT_100629 [Colletotrichum zoysiae]